MLFLLLLFVSPLADQWVRIGDRIVDRQKERDIITPAVNMGRFNKIQIQVFDNDVHFSRVVVHFGDGSRQDVPLREIIKKGQRSRVIDLKGGNRLINRVVFYYETQARGRRVDMKKGRVRLFGLKA